MINILKFKKEQGDKIFFFSDFHHSHAKLLESRGFSTIKEHDEFIINGWNSVVDNESIVFYLGDLVLGAGDKGEEVFSNLLETLNYKELFIMPGNHFSGYRQFFNKEWNFEDNCIDSFYRLEMTNLKRKVYFIPNYYEIFIGHAPIVLSHYPILSWNGQRAGSIFLHGHCHNSLHKTEWLENNYYKGRVIDVGYENIKKPISFNELQEIINKREIITFDHH